MVGSLFSWKPSPKPQSFDEWQVTERRREALEQMANPPIVINTKPGGRAHYGTKWRRGDVFKAVAETPGADINRNRVGARILNEPLEQPDECDMACRISKVPSIVERIERKWWQL